jgi:hypothetical protein
MLDMEVLTLGLQTSLCKALFPPLKHVERIGYVQNRK